MQILIDGYNLSMPKGTGVANYGKNLAEILSQAGHEVGIIFPYKLKNSTAKNKTLQPLLASVEINSTTIPDLNSRKVLAGLYGLQAFLKLYQIKELLINKELVIPKEAGSLLSQYRIFYKDAIFQLANAYFRVTNQLLPIRVPREIDVVHWTYPIPIYAFNKPNIYTIHDLVPMRLPYTTLDDKDFYIKSLYKIIRKASKIIAVSNHTKQDLGYFFNVSDQKIFVSWQSSKTLETQPSLSSAHNPNIFYSLVQNNLLQNKQFTKNNYFIFLGNIEPKKNIKRLIQAYVMSNVNQELIIVGARAWKSDEELSQLDKFRESGGNQAKMANQVRLMEYLPKDEMITLLANARALFFPSLYEGFGLPVLEAMQLGVPVLTSNTSSLPEVGGDAVLYVDPYDIKDISYGIFRLAIDDRLCQELSQKGMMRAEKFSLSSYQERMSDFYKSFFLEITHKKS